MSLDEMNGEDGSVRRPYARVVEWLTIVSAEQLERRRVKAELFHRRGGIAFAVHSDAQGEERIVPYDIIPRVLSAQDGRSWRPGSSGGSRRATPICATPVAVGAGDPISRICAIAGPRR